MKVLRRIWLTDLTRAAVHVVLYGYCTATCTKYMTRWFSTAQILPATHMYIYYNDCEYSYIVLSRLTLSKQIGIFIKTVGFFGGFSVYKWATFWAVKLHLYKWGRLLCFCNIFFALFHLCKGAFYKNRGRFARRPLVFWRLLWNYVSQ